MKSEAWKKLAEAVIELLSELFPKCFIVFQGKRKPLKVGIHDDLLIMLEGAITPQELGYGLCFYTRNHGYLRSMRVGKDRIDLQGNPAGIVTREESAWAKEHLVARRKKLEARQKSIKVFSRPNKINNLLENNNAVSTR